MITLMSFVAAVAAIVIGLRIYQTVAAAPTSTDRANDVAQAISEGATAFLSRQYRTVGLVGLPILAVVWLALGGWYGLGVWAYITHQVLVRGYYSRGNTRTPMRVAMAVVVLNLVLNVILVRWYEESGIALATAISAAVQVGLLATLIKRANNPLRQYRDPIAV